MPVERIVLVGFMGSGKTTVGRVVANRLGWRFLDLDDWIEAQAGKSVARIFDEDGEVRFRELECLAARETQGLRDHVIAAGCDADTLLARIPADGSRPLARNRETIRRLLDAREPSYRMADRIVAATGGPAAVAERVVEAVLPGRARP
jgi:shikimate kinase